MGLWAAEAPLDTLSREQKVLLLKRLQAKLASLVAALAAKEAGAPVTKVRLYGQAGAHVYSQIATRNTCIW